MKPPPAKPAPSPPSARRGPAVLAAIVIVGAILAAYHNSFAGALVFDDGPAIEQNATIRHWWPLWRAWVPPPNTTTTGRPLANFTLAVNYAISGPRVWSYHALNVLIHVLAALTLFGIVRRTLQRVGRVVPNPPEPRAHRQRRRVKDNAPYRGPPAHEAAAFGDPALQANATWVALAVALLWALHPLQVEAVTYVIQRVESLMALFFLLVFYCFLRSVDSPRERRWWAAAVAACLLGAATKEVIAVAPVLLLFFDRTFAAGSFREAWRRRRALYLGLASTWAFLAGMVASTGWNRNGTSGFDVGITPASYWLTQFEAITRYLGLAVWPHPLVFEYGTFFEHRFGAVLPYAIPVTALAGATLFALWRRPVVGFFGGWFFAILAPTSVIPGRIQMIVEHRMYLPLAGMVALAVAGGARRFGRGGLFACLALAAAFGGLTERRNQDYGSAIGLWQDTLAKRPDNARVYNYLGFEEFNAGRLTDAIRDYRAAIRLQPFYPEAYNNLGYALTKAGRVPEALEALGVALKFEPGYAIARNNLGNALLVAGRTRDAIEQYLAALQADPNNVLAHYDLGNALLAEGRTEEAVASYEAAVLLDPDDADARYNLGNALFTAGRMPEAVAQYRAVLRLQPGRVEAHSNLGDAMLQLGRTDEAIAEFETALRLRPDYAEGHNNLGAAFVHAGRTQEAIREFEAALRLKPDYPDARANLMRVRNGPPPSPPAPASP